MNDEQDSMWKEAEGPKVIYEGRTESHEQQFFVK